MTEMQRRFSKCQALRRGMRYYLTAEGTRTGRGYKRLWKHIIADVYGDMTEAQIKGILYSFLQCYDLTAEERAEIRQILQLSATALTENQRRQIDIHLQAE